MAPRKKSRTLKAKVAHVSIDCLPEDSLGHIFGYLDKQTRAAAVALVCKLWNRVEKDHAYVSKHLLLKGIGLKPSHTLWQLRRAEKLVSVEACFTRRQNAAFLLSRLKQGAPDLRTLVIRITNKSQLAPMPATLPLTRLCIAGTAFNKSEADKICWSPIYPVTSLLPLRLLRNLEALELQYVTVNQPTSAWSTLTSLTRLEISFLGPAIPKPVVGMFGLKELISRGRYEEGMFGRLAGLQPGLVSASLQVKLCHSSEYRLLPAEVGEFRKRYPGLDLVVDQLAWF